MDEVTKCTVMLIEALKRSEVYKRFKNAGKSLDMADDLRTKLDD